MGGWNVDSKTADRLNRLLYKFGQRYKLTVLHPTIKDEVHKAFKECAIKEPVLVLQNENSTDSTCYGLLDEAYYPVKAMALGVADKRGDIPLPLIRFSLYHECGHIVAGDIDQLKVFPVDVGVVTFNLGASVIAGIKASSMLCKNEPLALRVVAGLTAGLGTLIIVGRTNDKIIGAYRTRKKERKADHFAIKKLIELKDYETLIFHCLDLTFNIDEGKHNKENEWACFHDHPGYLERAEIITDALVSSGIDLAHIPNIDKEMQNIFNAQIAKYFPKYARTNAPKFTCPQ